MTGEELKRQIALYESADHTVHLDMKVDEDTVWLNRQQLALLFGRDIKTIGKHVGNALREELNGFSVVAKFATTASDGKTYQVEHYNLDMILSVGYRVKSKEGIYFRRWANSVLKQHLVDGYTINRKRLDALHAVVKVLSRSTEPEIAGTAEILERYLPSLVLLNDYDTGNVPIPKGDESQWVLTYEDAMLFIRSMPYMPITVVFANSFAHGAENAYIWLFAVWAYRNFCGALDWFSLSVGGVGVSRGGVEFVPVDAGPVCGRDAVVRFGRRCLFALPQGVGDE